MFRERDDGNPEYSDPGYVRTMAGCAVRIETPHVGLVAVGHLSFSIVLFPKLGHPAKFISLADEHNL
jgi:hypothetical protein